MTVIQVTKIIRYIFKSIKYKIQNGQPKESKFT